MGDGTLANKQFEENKNAPPLQALVDEIDLESPRCKSTGQRI
jgi:hypothetical protein